MFDTVLIVDDDPAVLYGCLATLGRRGFRVVTARTTHIALGILKTGRIELVLCGNDRSGRPNTALADAVENSYPAVTCLMLGELSGLDQLPLNPSPAVA